MGRNMSKEIRGRTFFKVLIGDFSDHLRIPPAFVKNFSRSNPLGKCSVTCPTGGQWIVNVEEDGEHVNFGSGWKDFVKAHCLVEGDFVVFKYCGKSKFRTKIYDRTCCEKIIPNSPRHHMQRKRKSCKVISDKEPTPHHFNSKSSAGGRRKSEKKAMPGVEKADDRRSSAGTALKRVSFKSENSHFIVPWTSLREHHLTIPRVLAREKNLLTKWVVVITDPAGKSWPVELNRSGTDGRLTMKGGMWVNFWEENGLEMGDTLVFEFTVPTTTAMQVHIFRGRQVVGEPSELYLKSRDKLVFNAAATSASVDKFEAD